MYKKWQISKVSFTPDDLADSYAGTGKYPSNDECGCESRVAFCPENLRYGIPLTRSIPVAESEWYSNFTQNRYRYLPVLVEYSPGIFKDTGIFQTMAYSSNKAHLWIKFGTFLPPAHLPNGHILSLLNWPNA